MIKAGTAMEKLTIKEIARIAGVSPSAVSIVINNKKGVSDETRKKVSSIIEKLQYIPNPSSRRLLFNKTNNIAILFEKNLSPMEHLFYSELNRVILHECETEGYNLMFTSITVENGNVIFPNIIKAYDVDGIILYGNIDRIIINSIKKFDIPRIVIDNHLADPETLSVNADYEEAASAAARHLVGLGHRDIAYIGNAELPNFNSQTFSGFKKVMEQNNISIPVNWIQMDANTKESAAACMKKILSGTHRPSAVLCSADIYAIGAIKSIRESGLRIPEDISITGIDDIVLSRYVEPPLTTVKIDKTEMGRTAFSMLIKKINGKDVSNTQIASDNLVARGSTCRYI